MPAAMVQYTAQGKGFTGDNCHCDDQPSLSIPENLPGYLVNMQINEVFPSHSRNVIQRGFVAWDCIKSEDNVEKHNLWVKGIHGMENFRSEDLKRCQEVSDIPAQPW